MVALQEELDWLCYRLYGLMESIDDAGRAMTSRTATRRASSSGERAFEIVMARQMAAGELQTSWFERHGSTPITEIPDALARGVPDARRAADRRHRDEPEHRPDRAARVQAALEPRAVGRPGEAALRSWLLDRLESDRYWPDPAQTPPELTSAARWPSAPSTTPTSSRWPPSTPAAPTSTLPKLVEELVAAESVPFLPVLRYKPSGLGKREVWERTWDLQRREDAGEDVGPIPVPPKYASADFLKTDFWRLRGKLDVPKERFVSYPHCSRDGDPSLVVGWAGLGPPPAGDGPGRLLRPDEAARAGTPSACAPSWPGSTSSCPGSSSGTTRSTPSSASGWATYYADFVRDEAQALGVHPGADQVLGSPRRRSRARGGGRKP